MCESGGFLISNTMLFVMRRFIDGNVTIPIGTLHKFPGHENRKTTKNYLHSFNETKKQAIRNYETAREQFHTTKKKALNSKK